MNLPSLPTKKNILRYTFLGIRSLIISVVLVAIFTRVPVPDTWADSVYWIGGTDSNWETASNWSTGVVPTSTDDVLIDSSATININTGTTIQSLVLGDSSGSNLPILNFNYDAQTNIAGACTIERDFSTAHTPPCGEDEAGYKDENDVQMCAKIISMTCEPDKDNALIVSGGNLHLYPGASITHTAGTTAVVGRVKINVTAGDLILDSGGSIDATGKGYQVAQGPGAGAGGSYGGLSGSSTTVYGSITNPTDIGSGGNGASGNGGGSILLNVSGTITNNGAIKSNGATGVNTFGTPGSGGSGGSVNITTGTLEGSGSISVIGGTNSMSAYGYWGNGGGGGRIAINYATNTYTGTVTARGGLGPNGGSDGGPGSIFTKLNGTNGDLTFDNTGSTQALSPSRYTIINNDFTFDNLTIGNLATVKVNSSITITNTLTINSNANLVLNPTSTFTYGSINWAGTLTDYGGVFPTFQTGVDLTVPTNAKYYANYPRNFANGTINGQILGDANTSSKTYLINLTFSGDLTISTTGSINATGDGYAAQMGPGAGLSLSDWTGSGGAGYASTGGNGSSGGGQSGTVYGSITDPQDLGSGGGNANGGHGGGLILLSIAGTFTNNGSVISNGANGGNSSYSSAGGGSGGSINITTSGFAGSGSITSNGGVGGGASVGGTGGGGAGGRIAIKYTSSSYSGTFSAKGGSQANYGGPGSIYTQASGTNGDLLYDNTGSTNTLSTQKGYVILNTDQTFDNLTIQNVSTVKISSNLTITNTLTVASTSNLIVDSTANITYSTLSWSANIIDNGGSMTLWNNTPSLTIPSGATYTANTQRSYADGTVNGTITTTANSNAETYKVNLSFTGNVTISSTGVIDTAGKGYAATYGTGAGTSGAGGSYGGGGGNTSSPTYGSITNPVNIGSGGAGAAGGGAIILNITGSGKTFTNNGVIKADGSNNSGAGAGGSINISIPNGTWAGNGSITANGGSSGNGGGGGRIAVTYTSKSYTGTITAKGGTGTYDGGPGSIYTKASGTNGDLLFDNTGTANSVDAKKGVSKIDSDISLNNLTLSNNATVEVSSTLSVSNTLSLATNSNLTVKSNAVITYGTLAWAANIIDRGGSIPVLNNTDIIVPSGATYTADTQRTFTNGTVNGTVTHSPNVDTETYKLNLTFTNLTIASGGTMDVSGRGYASTKGPGAGTSSAGGTYGGQGGNNTTTTYGDQTNPVNLGSGGAGGSGGGTIILSVTGTLTVGGTINANGTGNSSGSGAGGSINVHVATLTGAGNLSANGGSGGQGGGGGRIAVIISASGNGYTGTIAAIGGTTGGGNGTVYPNTIEIEAVTATNISDHSSTLSANISQIPINGLSDRGFIWSTKESFIMFTKPLAAYYLNEVSSSNAIDSIGGQNLTVTGTTATQGLIKNARYFNGTSDYLRIATFNNFNSSNFSISLWVKTTSQSSGVLVQLSRNSSDSDTEFVLTKEASGVISFWDYNGSYGFNNFLGTKTVNDGNWHNVIFVKNGINGYIYIDGDLDNQMVATKNCSYGTNDFVVGRDYRGSNFFEGSIDSLQVFNLSLDLNSIGVLYNNGTGAESEVIPQKVTLGATGSTGTMSSDLTDLLSGTTYYFKPYATASSGVITYGDTTSFTTTGATQTGYSVTNITNNSATIGAISSNNSNYTLTSKGIVWSQGSTVPSITVQPIHAYYFNELTNNTMIDSVGSLYGTVTGTTVTSSGKISNGRTFNGSGDYIQIARPVQNDFTVCAWIQTTTKGNGTLHYQLEGILDSEVGGYTTDFGFGIDSNGKIALGTGDGTDYTLNGATVVTTGNWVFVCGTRNQTTGLMSVYVNGNLDGTMTGSKKALTANANARIGYGFDVPKYFNGTMDDILIYDKELSASDIAFLYNQGNGVETYGSAIQIPQTVSSTTGPFVAANLTNLLPGTTYSFKPYVVNLDSTTTFGSTYTFTTTGQTMSSNNLVSNLTNRGGTLRSNISTLPFTTATDKGFLFGNSSILINSTPVHAYYFNEANSNDTVVDSIAGADGTNNGSTITTGLLGNARSFDTSSYILTNSYGFDYNYITIEAWIYASSLTSRSTIIDMGTYTSLVPSLEVGPCNGGSYTVCAISPSVYQAQASNNSVSTGKWLQIVYTKNGGGATNKIYVNGIEQTLVTNTSNTYNSTIVAKNIGRRGDSKQYFNGLIDNIKIYNKALTQSEITSLYNSGVGVEAYTSATQVSLGAQTNKMGEYISTDITGLSGETTYYFRPYTVLNGTTFYGSITSFTTNPDNNTPTVSASNIIGADNVYPGKTLDLQTIYSDPDGSSDLTKLYLQLKNPDGTNIEYYVNNDGTNKTGQTPVAVSGSEYISAITYDITNTSPTSNDATVIWHIKTNWTWTRSTTIQYGIRAIDSKNSDSEYVFLTSNFAYTNIVEFLGSITATDYNDQNLTIGQWTKPNSTVTFSGIKVVYQGTNVSPDDADFDVSVTNAESQTWTDNSSSGRNISIPITTVDATNSADTYSFTIRDLPTGAINAGIASFIIKTDKTNPTINSFTSTTYPDNAAWYTQTTGVFSWEIFDNQSGIQGIYYLLDNNADTADNTVISSGTTTTGSGITINNIESGKWYLHLVVKDNCENISSSAYSFNLDSNIPDIVAVTGLYDNIWQNVDAGPIISWTNPNSSSGDTYYITNDGSTPTSSHYTYTTTEASFDLPNQPEGQTNIKVVALNGTGQYSTVRTFTVKYDISQPVISTLTSSTYTNTASWYPQTTGTFSWTVSDSLSGIQNIYYLVDNTASTSDETVVTTGASTISSSTTVSNISDGEHYFHLVVKDNCGNTSSTIYVFHIDNTTPDIVSVTGQYDNIWQNIDAGPVISWTNPNSVSGDTYYITNDGSTPTKINYRYTTTLNTFDLPDQPEGQNTIKVVALNGTGQYSVVRSFTIKYDKTGPVISNFTSSTYTNQTTWYSQTTGTFTWNTSDNLSGVGSTKYVIDTNENTQSTDVISSGNNLLSNSLSLADIPNGIQYLHLAAKDNAGNISSLTYKLQIDTSIPDIIAITGQYDNVWQNVDSGPVISWTNPSSPSGDTYYITNDGSTPTSNHYTYTTASNTFDLPNQPEGQTIIEVVAKNGAGVYSVARTFTIKYDNTSPVINTLASSTNPDQNTWYASNNISTNWNITDSQSGLSKVYMLLDQNQTQTNNYILTNGTQTTAISSYETTTTEGTWYFHILAVDNEGLTTQQTYKLNIDSTAPVFNSLTSSTHPSQTTWYTAKSATFTWSASDNGSGVAGVWALIDEKNIHTTSEVLTGGSTQLPASTTWTSPELPNGVWYLHLVAKDNIGRATYTNYKFMIDSSIPDIVAVNGANNGVWQNTDAGPVISWTNPNSPSGDVYYITNDGSTPTSTNYTYTTNLNSFDLPNQKEGETTITVRSLNGAGTYSQSRTFTVRYDSTAPANVSNLTATSTNISITLTWKNPTVGDFSKTIVIRNDAHIPITTTDGVKVCESNSPTCTDLNLPASTKYYYTVFAVDGTGNRSSGATIAAMTSATQSTPSVPEVTNDTKEVNSQDLTDDQKVSVSDGVTNTTTSDTGDVKVYTGQTVDIQVPAKTITTQTSDVKQVVLVVQSQAYNMEYDPENDTYKTSIVTPNVNGTYDTTIQAIGNANKTTLAINMSLNVDPYGYVYSISKGNEIRISNARVTLYTKVNNEETIWQPAETSVNPQVTNETGEFYFYVQPGEYKLKVEADGYVTTDTGWFTVEGNTIEKNIEVKEETSYVIYDIIAGVVLASIIIVFVVTQKDKIFKKKQK